MVMMQTFTVRDGSFHNVRYFVFDWFPMEFDVHRARWECTDLGRVATNQRHDRSSQDATRHIY